MEEEGALVEGGFLWSDWKSARVFFEGLNRKAQLGWDNDTISNQVGQYLEQRYLTDTGGLDPWLTPVTKPEDGMENTLRDALHTMKLQLKQATRAGRLQKRVLRRTVDPALASSSGQETDPALQHFVGSWTCPARITIVRRGLECPFSHPN